MLKLTLNHILTLLTKIGFILILFFIFYRAVLRSCLLMIRAFAFEGNCIIILNLIEYINANAKITICRHYLDLIISENRSLKE